MDINLPCRLRSGIMPSPRALADDIIANAPNGAAQRIQQVLHKAHLQKAEPLYIEYYKTVLKLLPPIN